MTHTNQINEGVVQSMRKAGIPQRLFDVTLNHFAHPQAHAMLDWVIAGSRADTNGLVFIGGHHDEQLACITARGLHLTSRTARVLPLVRYVDRRRDDREALEDYLAPASSILLTQCGPQSPREACPFTPRELLTVQTDIQEWFDQGIRVLLHFNLPITQSWFSPPFLQLVATHTSTVGATR